MSPDKSGDCFMGGGTLQVRRSSDDPLNRRAAFYVDRILNGAKPYIAGNRCITFGPQVDSAEGIATL
jgi:hypothetical protein